MSKLFHSKEKAPKEKRSPTLALSVAALAAICLFIAVGVGPLGADVSIMLFLSWLVFAPFGAYLGFSFSELESAAYDMAKKGLSASTIIMAVGITIGTWMASGTVPTVLVLGLELITPHLFLLVTMVLCSCMSLVTGSSWGTMGTAGVAMFGVGAGLGIDPAITLGAIVSGAYFGDKMSPMSDTTLMASTITGTPLMTHVRYMCYTGGPIWILSGVLYTLIGMMIGGDNYDATRVEEIIASLSELFRIGFVPLIPILVVVVMLLLRKNTILTMLTGSILATIVAVIWQGMPLADVLACMNDGFSIETEDAVLSSLLNRGGMEGMLSLLATFIGALGLGGMLANTEIMEPVIQAMTKIIRSGRSLMVVTMLLTYFCLLFVATNMFAFAMLGTLLAPLFARYNLKSQNLSRILEDCGTLGGVLFPWNVGAIFVMGLFELSPLQYGPWAFQNYLTPIVTLLYALTGFKIAKIDPKKEIAAQE